MELLTLSKSARLSAEALEAREVPSVASALLSGKTLVVTADDAATQVAVALVGADIQVEDVGEGTTWKFLSSVVSVVEFRGGAGDDRFSAALAKPVRALGGAGDDSLTGGSKNDSLTGGEGDDSLVGGLGNDRYVFAAAAAAETDTVVELPAAGTDTLDFTAVATGVATDLSAAVVVATHANRVVRVGAAGLAANLENVVGGAGADTLAGNAGNNKLSGGAGNDVYRFDPDAPLGSDTVYDTGGNDTLDFSGSKAGVVVDLGRSSAQVVAEYLTLTITSAAVENATGGAGADSLSGTAGRNTLDGGGGNDFLAGGAGDDVYLFRATAAAESDTAVELPGEGVDTLDFSPLTTAVTVNLASDTALAAHANRTIRTGGVGQAIQFENATGGAGADTVTGNGLDNRLVGGAGADTLDGGVGDDALLGGSGDDSLAGGSGDDRLNGGAGADTLAGGDGNDTLIAVDGGATDRADSGPGLDGVWVDTGDATAGGTTGEKVRVVGSFANGADRTLDGDRVADPVATGRTYKSYAGRPLYASDGPSVFDIKQGGVSDCWLMAGLGAVALDSPNTLRQSVVDFDDGTYGVVLDGKFYRVDDDLPGNGAALGREGSLWVAITEKAFAYYRSGIFQLPASYRYLGGGWGREVNRAFGNSDPGYYTFWQGGDATDLADVVAERVEAREAVTIGYTAVGAGVPLVANHSYTVMGVERDAAGEVVSITVRNPWGKDGRVTNDANAYDGLITLTPDQLAAGTGAVNWGKV